MFPVVLRRRVHQTFEHSQLMVLRQVIALNRSVTRARRWLQPVAGWLWLLPISFLVGMVSVMLIRLG